MDNWWLWALIALGILVVVAGLLWMVARARRRRGARASSTPDCSTRPRRPHSGVRPTSRTTSAASVGSAGGEDAEPDATDGPTSRPDTRPRAAIVVNPTKFDSVSRVRADLDDVCRTYGWGDLLWLETTEEDPGYGQTMEALAAGVDLVCALGGDGTVRVVGSAMVGSDVPMGLLSGGTGNLLARNLSLPSSASQGMVVALTGRDDRIDTATLRLRRPPGEENQDAPPPVDADQVEDLPPAPPGEGAVEDHVFLVMAGLGFDAEVMANAPEDLKNKMGWVAYLVAGLQRLRGSQFKVHVTTSDDVRLHRRVRSVMVGNVGKLTGGVNLVPQAKVNDGILDLVLLSPEGLVGWAAVVSRVLTRSTRGHQRVEYFEVRSVEVTADEPIEIQLDGDTLGKAISMSVAVNPGSLVLRRPA
ncbi:diacylglycerol/lipid kinase family protein [Ornithinimicrobium ciconiae]|nr:diacylglycerol kinase family protein [Ornithinimicrobium ciconiae]